MYRLPPSLLLSTMMPREVSLLALVRTGKDVTSTAQDSKQHTTNAHARFSRMKEKRDRNTQKNTGGAGGRPRRARRALLSPGDVSAHLAAPEQVGRWGTTAGKPCGLEHGVVGGGAEVRVSWMRTGRAVFFFF